MPMIAFRDAAFSYENHEVVSGLRFEIQQKEYLCIVGENGAGKSTLMKGLLRMKQPSAGKVVFSDTLKPNQVGYLPQQSAAQRDFPADILEIVLSGRLNSRGTHPFYTKQDYALARENIRHMGLSGMEKRGYRTLSGGQQQRVLLARALTATHTMLLLDEPAAGLDPVATMELYRLIADINTEMGITIVMISHDMHSALQYASHILHLKNRQVFHGTTEEYRRSHAANLLLGENAYA